MTFDRRQKDRDYGAAWCRSHFRKRIQPVAGRATGKAPSAPWGQQGNVTDGAPICRHPDSGEGVRVEGWGGGVFNNQDV